MTTQQVNPMVQNMNARAMLLGTGVDMVKRLQPVTASAMGQTMRITLERMGITTGVMLNFTIPVNITATATASEFAPYNLVGSIKYTDFAGVNRVLTSGYGLHVLNCMRCHKFLNNSHKLGEFLTSVETGVDTNILSLPTAISTANIQFSMYVPLAYDAANDLRGAVLSQTITGDHTVTIELPSAFVGADTFVSPYSAGTVALQAGQSISVEAYQMYIMPQNGVNDLPLLDLSTIYGIEGNVNDSSNITSGQSKYINWVNQRSILSTLHVFNNGGSGTLNGTDVSQITLMGNSNTNLREMSPKFVRNQMRYAMGADFASGVYYIGSRTKPIQTQLYGNVQTRFDVVTANSGAYFNNQFESFYLAGTPLPGVIQ